MFIFVEKWLKVRQCSNVARKPTILQKIKRINSVLFCQTVQKTSVFWKNSRIPKRPFEINWPIAMTMTNWQIFAKWMWVNFQSEINRFSCMYALCTSSFNLSNTVQHEKCQSQSKQRHLLERVSSSFSNHKRANKLP